MDIFLGFAPYVAFFVVLRMGTVEAAMWAAFAVRALVALYGRWRRQNPAFRRAFVVYDGRARVKDDTTGKRIPWSPSEELRAVMANSKASSTPTEPSTTQRR